MTDPLDDLSIPLRVVSDEFGCAICFEMIKDCATTPCGHNFCHACILECLNRKHSCPFCNKAIEKTQLIKNHHYDKLICIINEEKEKASKAYFERLINNQQAAASKPSNGTTTTTTTATKKETSFSPIEAVFHKHLTKSLISFEEYYNELKAKLERNKEQVKKAFAVKMAEATKLRKSGNGVTQAELDKQLIEQLNALQKTFDNSVSLLVSAYENHMQSLAPIEPWNLPVSITLTVPTRDIIIENMTIQPSDTVKDLRELLKKKLAERGHILSEFARENVFTIRRPFDGSETSTETTLSDETKTVTQYKIEPGSLIILKGDVAFDNDKPKGCLTKWFAKDNNPVVDYFTCVECKLNWICSECAIHCHRGHQVKTFIKNHKTTWACCYCASKKCASHKC
eukprot:TRINITY_DN13067_c0_g1_i1.p1 TRINITY_DN13067_c0_g1~~TRINITY_DN13067_c0_g1_i1.p1  ORF type:complete len:398 (-),score=71.93 TRINITY_DN13067_c0_g1_i1:48-1241(-)